MGDVVEEGMARTDRAGGAHRSSRIAFQEAVVGQHQLGEALGAAQELAVWVGRQQRQVGHVGVGELDAEQRRRLRLDDGPGGEPAKRDVVTGVVLAVRTRGAVLDQPAGRYRLAGAVEHVLAEEHLVRGVRRIGLVLVDERRRLVVMLVDVVGRAEHPSGPG
jgi:hypothetical protein